MTGNRLRILIAEEASSDAAAALGSIFPDGETELEVSAVSTLSTLLASLERTHPEVIVFDLSLGRPDPLEAVRRIHRSAPGIPLIVLAAPAEKGVASGSLTEGAMDYLLKGFMDRKTIERVVHAALENNTMQALADLLRDPLTSLYSRDGLSTLGRRVMESASHSGGTLVLLCVLIENYSALQSEFSTAVCEQAVLDIAALLAGCFRRTDYIARLGESQFAALAVDAAEPSAPILRQRVETRLAVHNQTGPATGPLALRMSVSFWGRNDHRNFAELLDATESGLRRSEGARKTAPARELSLGRF
ncbi:MAG TPA: diguanylate cyclase [Candidatus Acidoferrum sp.]|nr:diguanylate cyclase [Candidatus Acidoferrum sp.]